jgi:hypothetical protein
MQQIIEKLAIGAILILGNIPTPKFVHEIIEKIEIDAILILGNIPTPKFDATNNLEACKCRNTYFRKHSNTQI